MENFEIRLKEFEDKCENLKTQEFENFGHLERAYCDLINEGSALRQYIIQTPDVCDKKSLLVLTNQVNDLSLLNEKFKSLTNILNLTVTLLQKYSQYVQELLNENKFTEAINIYEQMYKFTQNPIYKKNIIEIYAYNLNDYDKAIEVCEAIMPIILSNSTYCRLCAKIHSYKSNMEKTLYYNQKADELDMIDQAKDFIAKEDYMEAIKIYDNLFELTGNFSYQKEIANIHAVCLLDVDKAILIYKMLENDLKDDAQYWWQLSELYEKKNNLFRQVLCIQRAIKIELKAKEAS